MPDPTDGVPETIEAGNSYAFLVSYSDYPVADYDLEFCIQSGFDAPKIIQATVDESSFLVTLSTEDTQDLPAGEANWGAYAKGEGTRYTAETGKLKVTCNLARAKPKSYAQQQLEHWQGQYALMDTRLQSASSVSQTTRFSPEKIRTEMERWQAVVDVESKREEYARSL